MFKVHIIRHDNSYDLEQKVNDFLAKFKPDNNEPINITTAIGEINGRPIYLATIFYKILK